LFFVGFEGESSGWGNPEEEEESRESQSKMYLFGPRPWGETNEKDDLRKEVGAEWDKGQRT